MPVGSLQSLGYLPVATAGLASASVLACDLFIQRSRRSFAELYRGRNYPLSDQDLERLRQDGIDCLYIRADDANAYREYLCQHVLHQPKIPVALRIKALREVTRVAFEDAMAASDCGQLLNVAGDFGRDLARMVAQRSPAFSELFKTLEHDYCTFTHVCNVSLYCAVIARSLGTLDVAELADLTAGGLLHDIGKRHIPPQILNKTDKLTSDEWNLIHEHPVTGFRELANRGDLSWAQLMVVYQHHERLDGTGYPAGVKADEIHLWARICAVADVFDGLTCHRPYRRALPVADACDHLKKHAGRWFDSPAVECWTAHVRSEL
jgi:HD-GYP domain-containing protein (c-di-GMP phosphodiesterase class II)